ncbi:hypothetical protein [Glaciihabitans sp. dw_435]|uniref:hypothetical protein n=1 Tax=Glaciihabitans sp. dw_435 TaxID=2720081 RepID=UPI001BD66B9D|nr:hypothetical protein [Glaciihabitans sp. dw_435]
MTITVTADPTNAPPRTRIVVATPAGSVMSTLSVWRNVDGEQIPLREQPQAGFDSRPVDDFECPYGVPVTYGWSATYSTAVTDLWNETWASTAAWTAATDGPAVSAPWTVSGGTARNGGNQWIARDVAPGKYRVTIASLVGRQVMLTDVGGYSVAVYVDTSGKLSVTSLATATSGNTLYVTTINPAQPFTIDIGESSVTIKGTGGSLSVPSPLTLTKVQLAPLPAPVPAGAMVVGAIRVQAYATIATLEEQSATVWLRPVDAWLIHPATPARSVRIASASTDYASLTDFDPIVNKATATRHDILGSSKPLTTIPGNRGSDEGVLKIRTYTRQAEVDVLELLRDQVPILVNIPADWMTYFKYAFYQIGDVAPRRLKPGVRYPHRDIDLPYVEVEAPVVDVANNGWSWAQLAADFPTWNQVKAAFATWNDMAINKRRPGF